MKPELIVRKAIDVAEEGLAEGEMPIGAVVFSGDRIIAQAFTKERELGRRVVHADLLAMIEADSIIGFKKKTDKLVLGVNLEPCMMCMGAAITLGVDEIYYALSSPNDGAHQLVDSWHPPKELSYFKKPQKIVGGFLLNDAKDQFRRYAEGDGPQSMRDWARDLAD